MTTKTAPSKDSDTTPAPEGIPVAEAADTLGNLLMRVSLTKEEIVITRHGKPLAKLVPIEA